MKRTLLVVTLLAACGSKGEQKPVPVKDDAPRAPINAAVALPPAKPLPVPPAGLPTPVVPASVTPEAGALGELLFWDPRMSANGKLACATCHDPAHGYASSKRMETAEGVPFIRRPPTLVNLAWHKELGWDGRYQSMGEHLEAHMPGQLGSDLDDALARIADVPGYRAQFTRLGGAPSTKLMAQALESFVLTRYDGDSPWDKLERSPDVPADVKAGYQLFQNKAQCAICHTPPLYTDLRFHKLGVIGTPDDGRGRVDPAMKGAFKTPTLRGAADHDGFFHDASIGTLDAAIDWHLAGGIGQGASPTIIDPALKKLNLSKSEREQLGAFVRALTAKPSAVAKPALP